MNIHEYYVHVIFNIRTSTVQTFPGYLGPTILIEIPTKLNYWYVFLYSLYRHIK